MQHILDYKIRQPRNTTVDGFYIQTAILQDYYEELVSRTKGQQAWLGLVSKGSTVALFDGFRADKPTND